MKHPRTDLRAIHGEHMAEGTREVLLVHLGDLVDMPRPPTARTAVRSPEALARRRHRGVRLEA